MSSNKPISMWGYLGYQILFGLPVIGWICALILSFGSANVNVRNFSRSYFCKLILGLIFLAIVSFLGITSGLIYEIAEYFTF